MYAKTCHVLRWPCCTQKPQSSYQNCILVFNVSSPLQLRSTGSIVKYQADWNNPRGHRLLSIKNTTKRMKKKQHRFEATAHKWIPDVNTQPSHTFYEPGERKMHCGSSSTRQNFQVSRRCDRIHPFWLVMRGKHTLAELKAGFFEKI